MSEASDVAAPSSPPTEPAVAPAAPSAPTPSLWARGVHFLAERWFSVDHRALGIFRIAFGLVLLTNLYDRASDFGLVSFYSNEGVLPNHYALFLRLQPGYWSFLLGLSTPAEVSVGFALIALVYVLYLVGWKTRWMQLLALLCIESLNFRFLVVQHGGAVVVNILAALTLFLPLGRRYSVDAWLQSLRHGGDATVEDLARARWRDLRKRSATVSVAFFVLCLQFAVIYFFNTVQKTGPSWRDGSAVHDLAWVNRLATPLAVWLRTHGLATLSPILSWGTLVVEGVLPLLILSPWLQRWLRPVAFLLILGLHGGISSLSRLAAFSWAMMCFGTLLLTPSLLDWLEARWARRSEPLSVPVDWEQPAQRLWARVAARLAPDGVLSFVHTPGHLPSSEQLGAVLGALPFGGLLTWAAQKPLVLALARRFAEFAAPRLEPRAALPPVLLTHRLGRLAAVVIPVWLAVAIGSQVLVDNFAVPPELKPQQRSAFLTAPIEYLDLWQGWRMFAPETPANDYRMVVDATLADGTHLDVLTEEPPDFEPWRTPYWGTNQHWCEFHGRFVHQREHWRYTRDYLRRLPQLKGWPPSKHVVALEVWKVGYDSPPLGGTEPHNFLKERLFGDEPL